MNCIYCGSVLPKERIKILRVNYCVKCAENHTPKLAGFMVFSHKTAGYLVILNESNKEQLRLAKRANRRSR